MLLSISTSRLLTKISRSHFIFTSYNHYKFENTYPFLWDDMLWKQLTDDGHSLIFLWLLVIWLWLLTTVNLRRILFLINWLLIVVRLRPLSFGLNKLLFLLFPETDAELFSLFDGILELSYIWNHQKQGKKCSYALAVSFCRQVGGLPFAEIIITY